MAKDGEATFRINIDGNASVATKDIAASARLAATSITAYENEVKVLSGDLRRLRGNSDEVNAAKAALKKRIDEAKTSASSLTAELIKQGTSYSAAAAAAKKYGDGVGRLPNLRSGAGKVVGAAGRALSPAAAKAARALEPVTKRLGALFAPIAKTVGTRLAPAGRAIGKFGVGAKKAFVGVGKAAKQDLGSILTSLSSMMGVVASGAGLAAIAIAAVGGAALAGAAAIAYFGISAAAAASKMQLQREALLGNAKDAGALGNQISALAGKVPQGTAELNELALSLSKTRLSGTAMVNTMAAVAQATGAVDAGAGAKIQEIITRGQMTGRMAIGQFELQGTGIDFEDVAKEYAAGTKKSISAARQELFSGIAPLEAGAEAIKKATEKKFGDINIKNAFSLENAPKKLAEQLAVLSKGVDLSPISKGLQDAFGQLSPDAPLGAAIKMFMETFGNGLVDIAAKSIPILIEGFKWMLVWGLKIAEHFYDTKKKIKDAFAAENWVGMGGEIIKGLYMGIIKGNGVLFEGIANVGKMIKKAFTDELQIKSPSKVFEGYGRNTTEGYAQGIERGTARASGAVEGMAEGLSGPRGGGSGGSPGGASETIQVVINGAPTENVQAMQSPEFLAQLTAAIRAARTMRAA